jgi:hypothetical protein
VVSVVELEPAAEAVQAAAPAPVGGAPRRISRRRGARRPHSRDRP